VEKRSFNQSVYESEELKMDTLSGFAYKFILFLPLVEPGRRIFASEDEAQLRVLFNKDFGGCTYLKHVVHPLLAGEWIDEETGKTIINDHSRYEIYAKQTLVQVGANL